MKLKTAPRWIHAALAFMFFAALLSAKPAPAKAGLSPVEQGLTLTVERLAPIYDASLLAADANLQAVADEVAAYCASVGNELVDAAGLADHLRLRHDQVLVAAGDPEYVVIIVNGVPVTFCVAPFTILVDDGEPSPVVVKLTPSMML